LHPDITPRKLDNSDEDCKAYGLSLYKTLKAARNRYTHLYCRYLRNSGKEKFKQEKGENIAELNIKETDGVQSEPNIDKHFTFHPYSTFEFSDKINGIFDIFVIDETS
jgi:hypothetical protein